MQKNIKISLIISFYKNFSALELVFKSLLKQTFKDFEVIIAEDDNNFETKKFIELQQKNVFFEIKHVNHLEKLGFRKTLILNEAVKISRGEILVFIDGDILLHKNMLLTYFKNVKSNHVCVGRRIYLDEKITSKIYESKNIDILKFWNILFTKTKRKSFLFFNKLQIVYKTKKGIVGSNWSITKEDFLSINGFDEDYIRAGVGEDTDVRWRLRKKGLIFLSVKFSAIVFHLYHKRFYSQDDMKHGFDMMYEKQKYNNVFCKNGIVKN